MHFELPRLRIHSSREFIKHYLMIVLGILTALGLEQWIEHVHHSHAAAAATRQMTMELRHNLAETREALQQNDATLQAVGKLDAMVIADLKSSLPRSVSTYARRRAASCSISTGPACLRRRGTWRWRTSR